MASKSPPGLTPIIPVTRCELPVKRASGVASKAKKSASLPVLRRRRGRALSWRKAWIDIQRGGPTGWTKKTCAARRPGNAAERQNRKDEERGAKRLRPAAWGPAAARATAATPAGATDGIGRNPPPPQHHPTKDGAGIHGIGGGEAEEDPLRGREEFLR